MGTHTGPAQSCRRDELGGDVVTRGRTRALLTAVQEDQLSGDMVTQGRKSVLLTVLQEALLQFSNEGPAFPSCPLSPHLTRGLSGNPCA